LVPGIFRIAEIGTQQNNRSQHTTHLVGISEEMLRYPTIIINSVYENMLLTRILDKLTNLSLQKHCHFTPHKLEYTCNKQARL